MAGGQGRRWVICALAASAVLWATARPAIAVEAFDGRIQAHGFLEMQIRALNSSFEEELDLAQWYNVINLELEFDILPDGWGPFDLLQAYVRLEGRYDCIYSSGCGIFPSVKTYGNKSRRLPNRLRDAIDQDYGGAIPTNDSVVPPGQPRRINPQERNPTLKYVPVEPLVNAGFNPTLDASPQDCPTNGFASDVDPEYQEVGCYSNRPEIPTVRKREGFPGFDTLFDSKGADGQLDNNPDYTTSEVPARPVGSLDEMAQIMDEFRDRADMGDAPGADEWESLFRGLARERDDPAFYTVEPLIDLSWTFRAIPGADGGAGQTGLMGPSPDSQGRSRKIVPNRSLRDRANPFRGRETPTQIFRSPESVESTRGLGVRYHDLDVLSGTFNPLTGCDTVTGVCSYGPDPVADDLLQLQELTIGAQDLGQTIAGTPPAQLGPYPNKFFDASFGGDYSGIVAKNDTFAPRVGGSLVNTIFIQQVSVRTGSSQSLTIPYTNVAVTGGSGELPMRAAPDDSNVNEREGLQRLEARGLYLPSPGLVKALKTVEYWDSNQFNFNQLERSFNRGASQSETFELKEAYFDMEFLDSRLWIRAGLQNIVWGKTELFRTTDQFNPQDLALASLPSLEESRIGLLSGRAVYSFYDVGPLEDVRLELAANFDRVQPADLGACGEPYTIDVVCQITAGLALHGATGVGVAGVARPPKAWESIDGVEFGGRIEFRWDRFSFAITDFYGYNDLPYPDPIFFYSRGVDATTGRPLKAGATGPCENAAGFQVAPFAGAPANVKLLHAGNSRIEFAERNSATPDQDVILQTAPTGETTKGGGTRNTVADDYTRSVGAHTILGIGQDPDCLKPGGRPESANENRFDLTLQRDPSDPEFTLGYSSGDALANADANDPLPGTFIYATRGQWAAEGESVDFALANHPANQQLFTVVCSATVTIAVALAPGACAWNVFGTSEPMVRVPGGPPFGEVVSIALAGEPEGQFQARLMGPIIGNTKGTFLTEFPIRALNNDVRDGRNNSRVADEGAFNPALVPFRDPDDWNTLDQTLTMEQRALLGCGPFYGTRCDSSVVTQSLSGVPEYGPGGGYDVLNAEGSAILQGFPGIEGTGDFTARVVPGFGLVEDWVTWSNDRQPGTIGFEGGEYCTRYAPDNPMANELGLVRLPGCRGAVSVNVNQGLNRVEVEFEDFYTPRQDGCIFGPRVGGLDVQAVQVDPETGAVSENTRLQAELEETCFNETTPLVNAGLQSGPDISIKSFHRAPVGPIPPPGEFRSAGPIPGAGTLFHPTAGCQFAGPGIEGGGGVWNPAEPSGRFVCDFRRRDYESDFLAGNGQVFRNELSAWSWNFMVLLVMTSCNVVSGGDDIEEGDCFDPNRSWEVGRCSYSQPYRCRNVKGFLNVAGLSKNDVRAGGNPRFGRRDFIWHSGGELSLRYARRNVFGFSMDFAEDVTKTNWGMEFTWIGDIPFIDNSSLNAISDSGALNLTVSVDRPTFINFLNANRTFFMNTQWFFQYLTDYKKGFTSQGPFNVLFTFAVFTGYFQDRFLPQLVTVFDFRSQSGGFLPSISYRFTEAFSVTLGVSFFIGRKEYVEMPVRGFAPYGNRAGPRAYQDGADQLLALIRKRDEAFLRVRWTF
jgi:hypothetical protein